MKKILIIEDENLAADRLESMLKKVSPDCRVLAKIGSIKESVKWLMQNTADLIFLDIQLSDGLSFTIFERIPVTTPVIFTTAYDQYAIKAFQLNSVAYLLKPIKSSALEESLHKLDMMQSAFGIDFNRLMDAYQGKTVEYKKRFLIRIGDKLKKIETSDLAYCYAMNKSVFCKTFNNQHLPLEQSLDTLENLLDPARFFRINRRYLVNMDAIDNMIAWSRSRIKLELKPPAESTKDTIVSIDRSADFKKWLGEG